MSFFLANKPRCPVCDKLLDAVSNADDFNGMPQPGDVTVCSGCLTCLVFTDDLKLRFQRIGDLPQEQQQTVIRVRVALMAAKGWR